MKKLILITAAGVIGASILSFLYYAFVWYPSDVNGTLGYGKQLTHWALRFVLSVGFCWWLASYVNRGRELNRHGAFMRFLRSNWVAIAALPVMFVLFNIDGPIRLWVTGGPAGNSVWDFFVNRGVENLDAYIFYPEIFAPAPLFIIQTIFTQSFYYSWLVGFLVYRYCRARYMPDRKTAQIPANERGNVSSRVM